MVRGWRHGGVHQLLPGKQPREAVHVEGMQSREVLAGTEKLRSPIGAREAAQILATAGGRQDHPRGTEGGGRKVVWLGLGQAAQPRRGRAREHPGSSFLSTFQPPISAPAGRNSPKPAAASEPGNVLSSASEQDREGTEGSSGEGSQPWPSRSSQSDSDPARMPPAPALSPDLRGTRRI